MNAFFVYADRRERRGYVVHAANGNRARSKVLRNDPGYGWDYTSLHSQRVPALDQKPITVQSLDDAGFDMTFEGEPITYLDIRCDCPICRQTIGRV